MDAPLYNAIRSLTNTYPMHMPGHKRSADFLPDDLISLDITEIDGSDNLHAPDGVIADAQKKMAELYGCEHSVFCVNGGSSGILAAVLGTLKEDDTLLAVRNAHKSLQNALILSGAGARYLNTGLSRYGFAMPADADSMQRALAEYPDIGAVFIVSPTYEGFCADVAQIAEIVHKYGKILIVDETHGAHFPFNAAFPRTAMQSGADISVASWHKTLPVPNQCAVLNINGGRVDAKRIRQAFSMVTTTSPSYILMGLTDYVRAYYSDAPEMFDAYVKKLCSLRKKFEKLTNIRLADSEETEFGYDISKLTFVSSAENIKKVSEMLNKKHGFCLEMTGTRHIIAMTSPADRFDELERFADAVLDADRKLPPFDPPETEGHKYGVSARIEQRKLFYAEKELVLYTEAAGRTAADFVTPFPPDIPYITAGEKISDADVDGIEAMISNGTEILGLFDNKIWVLKE